MILEATLESDVWRERIDGVEKMMCAVHTEESKICPSRRSNVVREMPTRRSTFGTLRLTVTAKNQRGHSRQTFEDEHGVCTRKQIITRLHRDPAEVPARKNG